MPRSPKHVSIVVRAAVRCALLACVITGASARAQSRGAASLDVMTGAQPGVNGSWLLRADSRLALSASSASAFAYVDARFLQSSAGAAFGRARAEGMWELAPVGPLRFSLAMDARGGEAAYAGQPVWQSRVNVSARIGTGGAWLGAGRSDAGGVMTSFGAWRAIGRALLSLSFQREQIGATRSAVRQRQVSRIDSTWSDSAGWHVYQITSYQVDTTREGVVRSSPTLEFRGDWGSGRWTVSASGLRRLRNDSLPLTSGEFTVTAALNESIGLIASGGAVSRPGSRAGEPIRFASLGVRVWSASHRRPAVAPVRPAATKFMLSASEPGTYRVLLDIPGARTVEFSGDFNQWTPVSLRETSAGRWEAVVPMTSGMHRVNVRINGDRWTAPPGVPAVLDEFAGQVGLVIVP